MDNKMIKSFLCCYPRSGSSYLRFLVDKNTDYCIGTSHDTNKFDVKLTTLSSSHKKPIIALKTHHPQQFRLTSTLRQKINNDMNTSLLILIRNPYDVLRSWKKLENFKINDSCIRNFCNDWNNFISFYEKLRGNRKMFLTYEDLTSNTEFSLRRVCDFFGIAMNPNFENVDRQESIRRSNPDFIGTCKVLYGKDFFTDLQTEQIKKACGNYLIKYFSEFEGSK